MTKSVIEFNKQLSNLYSDHSQFITKVRSENDDATNPFLLQILQVYTEKPLRIMFFGQETNTWYNNVVDGDISTLMNKYYYYFDDITNYGAELKKPFFRMFRDLRYAFPDASFCWNNVLKVGKNSEKGKPSGQIISSTFKHFNLLKMEIEILQPDYLIFFSSYNYDQFIKAQLGGFSLQEINGHTLNSLAKIEFDDSLGIKGAYRTYHPGYLNRSGLWWEVIGSLKSVIIGE